MSTVRWHDPVRGDPVAEDWGGELDERAGLRHKYVSFVEISPVANFENGNKIQSG